LTAWFQAALEMFDVARTIFRVGEEVKDGAVVPEIDGRHTPLPRNVRLNPRNRRIGKSRPRTAERRAGNVNDRQALNTAIDKPIREAGISAPNVDHSGPGTESSSFQQTQRQCRLRLEPANRRCIVRFVHAFPMLLAFHFLQAPTCSFAAAG